MAGNEVRVKASLDDKVTTPLGQMEKGFEKLGKKVGSTIGGGSEMAKGVGLAAGVAGFALVGTAISAVTGFLGDSADAYAADQRSIMQLNASLKANTDGFSGNTHAIEKVLAARISLGFSDDEQRDSLAKLVAATHDSNKALDIQRVAMDLARFKGISLADATDALTKVEAGSFRVLKSLGIELKAGATQTDALAAVQRVAAGQAEAYANTNEGKLLVSEVRVHEAQEKFGKGLSNLSATIMPAAADAVEGLAAVLDPLSKSFDKMLEDSTNDIEGMSAEFKRVQDAATEMGMTVEDVWDLMQQAGSENIDDLKRWQMNVSDQMDRAERSINQVGGATKDMGHDTGDTLQKMSADYATFAGKASQSLDKVYLKEKHLTDELSDLANAAISDYFDPIIDHDKLMADEAEISANRRIIASSKATKAEKADARAALHELAKSVTETRIKLFEAGKLSKKEQGQLLADLRADWKSATGSAKARIAELIAAIERLQNSGNVNISVTGGQGTGGSHARAAGGPVSAGETYLVGEQGPELFTPGSSGNITSNNALTTGSSGSSSGLPQITVVIDGEAVRTKIVNSLAYSRGSGTFIPG